MNLKNNDVEMKPCPFCGSVKLGLKSKEHICGENGAEIPVVHCTISVRCNVCHARGGTAHGKVLTVLSNIVKPPVWHRDRESIKQDAIKMWNERNLM